MNYEDISLDLSDQPQDPILPYRIRKLVTFLTVLALMLFVAYLTINHILMMLVAGLMEVING